MSDVSPNRDDQVTYIDLFREAEQRRAEAEQTKRRMAREGETRVWLNGGILSPGSEEKTVITIYGPLSAEHRKLLLGVAVEIDAKKDNADE
jgi:hypothetical protein